MRIPSLCLLLALGGCVRAEAVAAPLEPVSVRIEPVVPAAKRESAPTERNAIALLREHEQPQFWISLHASLREHPLLRDFAGAFPQQALREAGIDPLTEIDAVVSGCSIRIGCFSLFEHHIDGARIRRFLDLAEERSSSPAERISEDPPAVRVFFASDQRGVAVLTRVNPNLLLASLRPAPELAAALKGTRGIEPPRDGALVEGAMALPLAGLDDGLVLSLASDGQDGLVGTLSGTARSGKDPVLVAERVERHLRAKLDRWWLPPVMPGGMKPEVSGRALSLEVHLDKELLTVLAAGIRMAVPRD